MSGIVEKFNDYSDIFFFIACTAVFFLFFIRPQKKREDQQKKYIDGLKKGDRIVMIDGLCGVVNSITDTKIIVEVDDRGHRLEFLKSAIAVDKTKEENIKKKQL